MRSGPPYDPAEIGLARLGVYLGGSDVVFVFEGRNVEQQLRDLVNDPAGSPAFAVWAPLLEGTPSIAHELFYLGGNRRAQRLDALRPGGEPLRGLGCSRESRERRSDP